MLYNQGMDEQLAALNNWMTTNYPDVSHTIEWRTDTERYRISFSGLANDQYIRLHRRFDREFPAIPMEFVLE